MRFVIRDDDLNYFSTPADIERWYSGVFAECIPVGFSTIPFVMPESDVYTGGATYVEREYPLHENGPLVEYVKREPLIEILQHGTTHRTIEGRYEYQGLVARGTTRRGREELERAFGQDVSIFVPPHDWIGTSGVLDVEEAGMDIIRGRGAGLRNLILRPAYAAVFLRMLAFRARHAFSRRAPAYPHVLDFGKHREACSYRLEDEDVFAGLEHAHAQSGHFVVVTHLHFYTEGKKERLAALIQRGRELGASFVPPSALFSNARP